MYLVESNGYFLKNTQYEITENKGQAYKWKKQQKAENFILHLPSKIVKGFGTWRVVAARKTTITNDGTAYSSDGTAYSIEDVETCVLSIEATIIELKRHKQKLFMDLSNVDKEIQDILHAAEFYQLNAAQGYKLYKMLHIARVRRRQYKDDIAKISFVLDTNIIDILSGKISSGVDTLKTRNYKPRVLATLFE